MSPKSKVLVIDDDADVRVVLRKIFSEEYHLTEAEDGIEGIKQAVRVTPDVVLLETTLPKLDGFQTCEALRKEPALHATPIIMISQARETETRIRAFRSGADDFLAKPFEAEELKARIESKLIRYRALGGHVLKPREGVIVCGNLTLEPQHMQVMLNGKSVRLGPIDFRLLRYLVEHRGRVCGREEILDAVWDTPDRSVRILDTHVLALRKKLTGFDHGIAAVYGSGYILKPLSA